MMRLMMAMGLLVLVSAGTGGDSEPEGSCTTSEISSGDHGIQSHEICQPDSVAAACAAAGGRFDEGGDCALFTLFRLPAVGAN